MNKNVPILYLTAACCWLVAGILYMTDSRFVIGSMFLCLALTNFCLCCVYRKKIREEDKQDE